LKWTDRLKDALLKQQLLKFETSKIRLSLYRPFCKKFLYFDDLLDHRRYQQHLFFPTSIPDLENIVIIVSDHGYRSNFSSLVANFIPELHLLASIDAFQCFPYYTFFEDGSDRRENITNWALKQFRVKYGSEVSKLDILHYIYAVLHHPQYRERYAENLKRDLPHIPLLQGQEAFEACVDIGKQLMNIHLNYEQVKEYPLKWIENQDVPFSWRIEKMRLAQDNTSVIVNESLTLAGIPQECFQYRLGNRSALDWVIDQYQVSEDKRSKIVSDPNSDDDPEYIVRLVGHVVTVSVETVKLVEELVQAVNLEDEIGVTVEGLSESIQ
jgi:predicted helicase